MTATERNLISQLRTAKFCRQCCIIPGKQFAHGASDPLPRHGVAKNSEKLIFSAKHWRERGIFALRFDFSYVGESSGKFEDITYSGEVEDLRAAYEIDAASRRRKNCDLRLQHGWHSGVHVRGCGT